MNAIDVNYSYNQITVSEFKSLRRDAGWPIPNEDSIASSLKNTKYSVAARTKDNQLIGYGRVTGDGSLCHYVSDVIVLKSHQKSHIGSNIMSRIMEYLNREAKPGAFVGLFSAKGLEHFYKKYGFVERPTSTNGAGMFYIVPNNDR